MVAFSRAIDALFADPNIGEDALWRAGGVGLDIRRMQAPAIAEGDLIVIGAETFRIIGEPTGDAPGLVTSCEAVKV